MASNWEPEQEQEELEPVRTSPLMPLSYQVNAHIALEDSDTQTWGMAKDTEGSFTWKTGEGVIVGKWSRSPVDGLIHLFLETPIMALVDKATQRFAEYAEMRREKAVSPKSGRTRTPKVPAPAPAPSEELITISNLRKLLGK